jgi:hypothetical protein
MPNNDVQDQRNNTRYHNIDVLNLNGFQREGISSVFANLFGKKILSPGVSPGNEGLYWFDIRKANLDRMRGNNNTWVLVRIVPNWFVLFKLNVILPYLTEQTQQIRPHSGIVWALFCDIHLETRKVIICSGSLDLFSIDLLNKEQVLQKMKEL